MTRTVILVEVPFRSAAWNILLALEGAIVRALLITLVPTRRARLVSVDEPG